MEESLYLLDTDICIFARRHKPESVLKKLTELSFDRVCLSVVTLYELSYGAEKHGHPIKARQQLRDFLRPFQIMEWTEEAAV
jgi:tRNA(fMet)-specific endonuclease VapC